MFFKNFIFFFAEILDKYHQYILIIFKIQKSLIKFFNKFVQKITNKKKTCVRNRKIIKKRLKV